MSTLPAPLCPLEQPPRQAPPIRLPRDPHPRTGGTGRHGRITAADREYGSIVRAVLDDEHGTDTRDRFELDTVSGRPAGRAAAPIVLATAGLAVAAVAFAPLPVAVVLTIVAVVSTAAFAARRRRPVPAPHTAALAQPARSVPVPGPLRVTATRDDQPAA